MSHQGRSQLPTKSENSAAAAYPFDHFLFTATSPTYPPSLDGRIFILRKGATQGWRLTPTLCHIHAPTRVCTVSEMFHTIISTRESYDRQSYAWTRKCLVACRLYIVLRSGIRGASISNYEVTSLYWCMSCFRGKNIREWRVCATYVQIGNFARTEIRTALSCKAHSNDRPPPRLPHRFTREFSRKRFSCSYSKLSCEWLA